METGLSGHPLTPQLPTGKPGPLFHLLERLREMGPKPTVRRLKCVLDGLEFTERYFCGVAGGLLRKIEDPPNLGPLAQNADDGPGLRRLLRFCINRLELHSKEPGVIDLFSCFYLHGKRSLPYSHTRWLGLIPNTESSDLAATWSYRRTLEELSVPAAYEHMTVELQDLSETLQSYIEAGASFFESYEHFARLDEEGWQCTLKKNDLFIELVPALPVRLIPLEAQAPTTAPQTEDEHLLSINPFLPDEAKSEPAPVEPIAVVQEPESVEPVESPSEEPPETETPPEDWAEPAETVTKWSAGELKSFKTSLQQVYPRLDLDRVPGEYFKKVSRFLSSVSSGYILVEGRQGTGKTLLTQAFRDKLLESSLEATPLLFSVKNQFYPDTATFLEQLNESLRIRPGTGRKSFEALDPAVIKDLNMRSPGDTRSVRFSSFLAELRLVNGSNIVLILDGLDEGAGPSGRGDSLFSYLPSHLPDGVYVIVSYHPDRCKPADREALEAIHTGPSTHIILTSEDGLYRDFIERFLSWGGHGPLTEGLAETLVEKSGGRLATAQHFLDGLRCELLEGENDLPPAELVYEGLLDRLYERVPDRYLDLFLLLATSDEPVSGEELSGLAISRTDVLELIHSLPSLFHCNQDRKWGLNLAHRALRLHIQRTFLTSYAQSCRRLAERALERISETELAILPVKEDLEAMGETLRRLLRWAIDSHDPEFLAKVCGNPTVNRLRRRIFAAMGERKLFHRKALVLDTFISGLKLLVEEQEEESFREELAWSLSSRALSYYHLGQYQRALEDIEKALKQFRILVDDKGHENLRNGLAAAYNRRSEIYGGLKEWSKALTDADRAVLNYESVVDSGRSDLMSLWMLSRHNRAVIARAIKSHHQAETDLDAALAGYLKLVDRENRRDLRPNLAEVYRTRALLALDQGNLEFALTAANASLDLLETLVHQENFEHLRNELASVYNDRGAILFQSGVLEEAEHDYASAISIRTFLVAEGRIDVRTDLAKTYANQGLCLLPRKEFSEARESFDRAVEILDRLIEEEKREDLYGERAFALNCRGSLHRLRGDYEQAREDLSAAVGDYRLAVVSQSSHHLEELASTLNTLAQVSLLAQDSATARKSCERVLEIFEEKLSPERRESLAQERAAAHHNLGEALREEGELARAEEEFKESIDLLTRLVEKDGLPHLTGSLAMSLLRYAQLPGQNANDQLKLSSRALALFQSSPQKEQAASWVECYLLRAAAFRELGSLGSALDDVTAVIDLLEERRWEDPALGGAMVSSLLERASLYAELHDKAASLLDLDRAAIVVDELDHLLSPAELELHHCHVILERIRLLTGPQSQDFETAVDQLRDLDDRLENLPVERLAKAEHRELRKRTIRTFKELRLLSLIPTREGGQFELAVERLSVLLKVVSRLRPTFRELLQSDWVESQDVDPISKLRTQRAWSLVKLERFEEALVDFEEALTNLPEVDTRSNPDVLEFIAEVESGRGTILDTLGRQDEALTAYSRGVDAFSRRPESALSPRRATCLNNRALLLQKMGLYEEALDDLDPAIEIARSNYQRSELLARSAQKANLQRLLGRTDESLFTLKDSLASGQQSSPLSAAEELPLQIGIYQLSADTQERFESLSRVLSLLLSELESEPQRWTEETTRLLSELPLPDSSSEGTKVEELIARTTEVLLKAHRQGYTPLTETLLRRASKVSQLAKSAPAFKVRASALYCLACKFCWLEYQKYAERSLPRLVRCYLLAAQSLVDSDPPAQVKDLGVGIEAMTQAVTLNPPSGDFEVEVNNMARLWLSLAPSKALQAGVSRATLLKLRRW